MFFVEKAITRAKFIIKFKLYSLCARLADIILPKKNGGS